MAEKVKRQDFFGKCRSLCATLLCAFLTCFTVYTIGWGQFAAQVQRGVFVLGAGLIVFLTKPFIPAWENGDHLIYKWVGRLIDLVFMAMLIYAILYIFQNYFEIASEREGWPNEADLICYALGSVCVLEAVRRTHGWMLLSVVLVVIAYLFWGHNLSGLFFHQPLTVEEILEMSFSMNGVFGIAVATVANVVSIFTILGAVLQVTGVGDLFIDLACICTGRFVGGPAQSAVIASALFGSINGSGPANVMSTGSFTIPLMVRSGYTETYAGAVSATASCVGQIMPPVMGVGAFLMAEITGTPYSKIMLVAVVPALLYTFSLLFNVRFQALHDGLRPLTREELPQFSEGWKARCLVLVITASVLLWQIFQGIAPNMAGLQAVATLIAGAFLVRTMRPDLKKIWRMFVEGGRGLVGITIACASIGIVIGGLSITGLGVRFSQAILSVGANSLFLSLVMSALCCIVVGMGLPTAASYLMVVFIAAPAIVKLGLSPLATHLFVFYYAVLSAITPPVALNAYTASGIAKSDPLTIGLASVRIGFIGFLLPFLWIYNPDIILGESRSIFLAVENMSLCFLSIYVLAGANCGFFNRRLNIPERLVLIVAGVLLALPSILWNLGGLVVAALIWLFTKKRPVSAQSA